MHRADTLTVSRNSEAIRLREAPDLGPRCVPLCVVLCFEPGSIGFGWLSGSQWLAGLLAAPQEFAEAEVDPSCASRASVAPLGIAAQEFRFEQYGFGDSLGLDAGSYGEEQLKVKKCHIQQAGCSRCEPLKREDKPLLPLFRMQQPLSRAKPQVGRVLRAERSVDAEMRMGSEETSEAMLQDCQRT